MSPGPRLRPETPDIGLVRRRLDPADTPAESLEDGRERRAEEQILPNEVVLVPPGDLVVTTLVPMLRAVRNDDGGEDMDMNLKRWVALGGLLFVALIVAVSAFSGSAPDTTASASQVVSYYAAHKSSAQVTSYLLEVAVIVGLSFFWYLRNLLIGLGADSRLTTLGFAGAIVFGVGGAVVGGSMLVMADAVNHVTPATLQGLSALQQDLNTTLSAVGPTVFLFATSIAILRSGALARWLGWLGIVMGLVSLPAFLGPLPAGVWVLVASIALIAPRVPATSGAEIAAR